MSDEQRAQGSEPKHVMTSFSPAEEALIKRFVFTNPDGAISLIYPQTLIAGEELPPLMSAYSRTHVPLQERVLSFLNEEKPDVVRAHLPVIQGLMDVTRTTDGRLIVSDRASRFSEKWVLAHGHNSIKEMMDIFGYVEGISDVSVKTITGQATARPQVKSTRYISFDSVLGAIREDPDLASLEQADEVFAFIDRMNTRYRETTEELTEAILAHPDTRASIDHLRSNTRTGRAPPNDESLRADAQKFAQEASRVYLTGATPTSVGFSADARTLERILTNLLSSQRIEERQVGEQLWAEARKIAPILLGERGHVAVNDWKVHRETAYRDEIAHMFAQIEPTQSGLVRLITADDVDPVSDRFAAALIAFPHTRLPLTDIYKNLSDDQVTLIIKGAHEAREPFDPLDPSLGHSIPLVEFTTGYHGYRDLFRHRKGERSVQPLSTREGFEVPEILSVFGMDSRYREEMRTAENVYEQIAAQNPAAAEKVVPFGARIRAIHSWSPAQIGYVARLRTNIAKGNRSYVDTARALVEELRDKMPLTVEQFTMDTREYPAHLWPKGFGWFDEVKR
jgi:thymidylate synthase ThyX